MATGSIPSSGTDGPDPQEAAQDDAAERPVTDPERRAFFFQFGRQAVSAVGQVAGMASAASRTANAMAGELLGLDEGNAEPASFTRGGPTSEPVVSAATPGAGGAFRSAYRMVGDELVLLDQRRIPEALEEVVAKRGSDVAYYLRLGVARGGPLMAQVAAYGLALTAAERHEAPPEALRTELRRTQQALVEARPSARLPVWALERQLAVISGLPESVPGAQVATALRAEAEAIASDMTSWQAAIAGTLAQALAPMGDEAPSSQEPPTVLLHGSQGALAGGQVGAVVSALTSLAEAGRAPRVFLTEGRPFMDGARLAAWELRQAGLEYRLVPDSAVAWLLARERIDTVLIGAEWVADNGDTGALVGSRGLALLAATTPPPRKPRVIVHGPAAVRDPGTPDGSAIPVELRPARELTAYLRDVPVRVSDALVPAADVIPAEAIEAFVTERGMTAHEAS